MLLLHDPCLPTTNPSELDGISSIWTVFSPHGRYSVHMDVSRPISSVIPSLEGEVLHTLAGSSLGMTGRQVALRTGRASHSGVLRALDRLAEQGIVQRVQLNRAYLFSLNRDHLAAPAVMALATLRTTLIDRMREEVARWPVQPTHGSLFGSTARGDGDVRSDIDLLFVRPAKASDEDTVWRASLDGLSAGIESWTGNRASVVEIAEIELSAWRRDPPAILPNIEADGILLAGSPLRRAMDEAP